ncbi:MAG: hypothetical protein KatS3mg050_4204 [Litorilinea sp.]|nr:MAG: hypothetical protein KatS3mg050_4204 [Litorilinea sp.]
MNEETLPDSTLDELRRLAGEGMVLPTWLRNSTELLTRASDESLPLPARLTALGAFARALDELFVVHLPGLTRAGASGGADDLQLAAALPGRVRLLVTQAARLLEFSLLPALQQHGFRILPVSQLTPAQQGWLHSYFSTRVYPLLTPLAVDPGHPFPFISSDSLNLLVQMRKPGVSPYEGGSLFARVKIPRITPRLLKLPAELNDPVGSGPAAQICVWSGDLVRHFVYQLFPGMPIQRVHYFRLLRAQPPNGPAASLNGSPARPRRLSFQPVVRLDVEEEMAPAMLSWLVDHLHVPMTNVFRYTLPLELMCLGHFAEFAARCLAGRQP